MNRDTIKYIAIFTMLLNHIANVFFEPGTLLFEVFVDVGYFTAITMCYFLVEGYGYTHSKEKYGKRLLLFAVISEIPFCLAFTEEGTISFVNMNMIFTLFLCFLILYVREKIPQGPRQNLCVFGRSGLGDFQGKGKAQFAENQEDTGIQRRQILWKIFGKAMLLFGLLNFMENTQRYVPAVALLHAFGAVSGIFLSGLCIIYLYNGKRAKKCRTFSKWFFYIFYPAHLLVLGVLRVLEPVR